MTPVHHQPIVTVRSIRNGPQGNKLHGKQDWIRTDCYSRVSRGAMRQPISSAPYELQGKKYRLASWSPSSSLWLQTVHSLLGRDALLPPTATWDQKYTGGSRIPSPCGTWAILLLVGTRGIFRKVQIPPGLLNQCQFLSELGLRK